jgi:hypothetical protein
MFKTLVSQNFKNDRNILLGSLRAPPQGPAL